MRRAVAKIIPNRQPKHDIATSSNSNSNINALSGANNTISNNNNKTSTFGNHLSNLSSKIDYHSIEEFYIILDEPHKSWLPGDEVSGQIILISKKNLSNISLTLSLVGYVKINASSHSKLRPVKHNLFNHTINIFGFQEITPNNPDDFTNGLYKGEHRFPFIVKLPNKRVFTSIDFGKGSIVYLLRGTIGNTVYNTPSSSSSQGSDSNSNANSPSNIFNKTKNLKLLSNTNYTSEKIIQLINPIDVSKLPPPKPKRLIIKDPRYAKILSRTQSNASTVNSLNTYSTISSNNSDTTTNTINNNINNNNNNTNNSNNTNNDLSINQNPVGDSNSSSIIPNNNTSISISTPGSDIQKPESIKVSLEIPQRGYLRGELIPIKLNIKHLKKLQDVNGIILTFVRVCRLNNGPEGLFESFRKDLQQSIIPLFVDPNTYKSEINTSVRVPADAFPTIVGCPLVSFQYFVEVLINLSGKSVVIDGIENNPTSGSSKISDELNPSRLYEPTTLDPSNFNINLNVTNPINSERSGYINTDKYKRMKKFIQITTEIVIGTHRLIMNDDNNINNNHTNSNINNNSIGVSPISRRSSLFSGSNVSSNNLNNSQPDSSPAQQTQPQPSALPPIPILISSDMNSNINPGSNSTYINAIPESSVMNNFETPPYFENDNQNPINMNYDIPNYEDISNENQNSFINVNNNYDGMNENINNLNSLSEKERMKNHELSLLPSEPPLEDLEDNDHETISSTERSSNILEGDEDEEEEDKEIEGNKQNEESLSFNNFTPPSLLNTKETGLNNEMKTKDQNNDDETIQNHQFFS